MVGNVRVRQDVRGDEKRVGQARGFKAGTKAKHAWGHGARTDEARVETRRACGRGVRARACGKGLHWCSACGKFEY